MLENDDNDTPEKAQEVPLPCEIAGRVEKQRDRDWYAFTAKKGDVLHHRGVQRPPRRADRHVLRPPQRGDQGRTIVDAATTTPTRSARKFFTPHATTRRRTASSRRPTASISSWSAASSATSWPARARLPRAHQRRSSPTSAWSSCRPTTTGPTRAASARAAHEHFTVFACGSDGFNGDIDADRRGPAGRRHLPAAGARPAA